MKFPVWFNHQFGRRPSSKPLDRLREEVKQHAEAAKEANEVYHATLEWEIRHTSSQYAWYMSDKEKK